MPCLLGLFSHSFRINSPGVVMEKFLNDWQTKAKANQRKKWRKSVIQLVPVGPPPSSQPENTEAGGPKKAENNAPVEADSVPLKLPRAMRSAATNGNNPFRVRNSDQPEDSSAAQNKEAVVAPPVSRSPVRQARASDEKENYGP